MSSSDVNAYLREITGRDVTAKDFRTWAGSVLAELALQDFIKPDSQAQLKKNLRAAIEKVGRKARQYADNLPQVLYPSRDLEVVRRRRTACSGQRSL
jgi:hypothetical protein